MSLRVSAEEKAHLLKELKSKAKMAKLQNCTDVNVNSLLVRDEGKIASWFGFKYYWLELQTDSRKAVDFVNGLLTELFYQIQHDEKKELNDAKKKPTEDSKSRVSRNALLNSLQFVMMTLNFDDRKLDAKLEANLEEKELKKYKKIEPRLERVKEWWDSRSAEPEIDFNAIFSFPDMKGRYNSSQGFGSLGESEMEQGEEALQFFIYHQQMRHPEKRKIMAQNLVEAFRALETEFSPATTEEEKKRKMKYDVRVRSILASFLATKQLIEYAPLNQEFVTELLSYAHTYSCWAKPVSTVARTLLRQLRNELNIPGYSMRRRVRIESNQAVFKWDREDRTKRAVHFLVPYPPSGAPKDNILCMFESVLSTEVTVENKRLPSKFTAAATVLSTLIANGRDGAARAANKLLLADERKVADMEENWHSLDFNAMETKDSKGLISRISAWSMDQINGLPPASEEALAQLKAEDKLEVDCAPRLAPILYVAHYSQAVDLQQALNEPGPDRPNVAPGEPLDKLRDLIDGVRGLLTGSECKPTLEDYTLDVPSSTVVLPIVIVGGNKQVQEVVRSYVNLIEECGSTQILGGVRIEFYVLPSKPCALASFLAAHDPWYRRNLFVPISTPAFLVPWPQDDNAKYAKAGEDSSICPPGKMLKYALDTMVRFSRNVTEIQVFKIDIWKEPRSSRSDMQSITIPFVARVEMGVRVAAAKVEEAKIKAGADAKENIAKNLMSDAKWLAALELPRLSVDFVAVGLSDNSDEQKEQVSYHLTPNNPHSYRVIRNPR
jgi:hypothetical protein